MLWETLTAVAYESDVTRLRRWVRPLSLRNCLREILRASSRITRGSVGAVTGPGTAVYYDRQSEILAT
jgi:hypothetical protein